MVVEQRVGMHRNSMFRTAPAQGQHEQLAINIRLEGQAVMRRTLDHVVGDAGQHEAFESSHVERSMGWVPGSTNSNETRALATKSRDKMTQ